MILKALGFGVLLPALVVLGVALALGARSDPGSRRAWVAPALALALGYVVAHLALHGFRGVLPGDVTERLPLVALVAGGLSLLDRRESGQVRRALLDAAAATFAALVLLGPVEQQVGRTKLVLAGLAFVTSSVLGSRVVHELANTSRSVLLPLGLAVVIGAAAGICAASGTVSVAELVGAVAAGTGAMVALGRLRLELGASARVLTLLTFSGLALAHFYAEMSAAVLAATAFALVAPGLGAAMLQRWTRWGVALGWGASVLALAFGTWRATRPAPPPTEQPSAEPAGEYDYGYQ